MKTLDLIRHLYDEEPQQPLERALEDEEALRDEYVALQETKAMLDRKPSARPDARTLDAIYAAARVQPQGRTHQHMHRLPLRRGVLRRVIQVGSMGLAACLIAVVGYWVGVSSDQSPLDILGEDATLELRQNEVAAPSTTASEAREAIPAWDDREDLRVIHWRVESLENNMQGTTWDQAVPLGAMQPGERARPSPEATQDRVQRLEAASPTRPNDR